MYDAMGLFVRDSLFFASAAADCELRTAYAKVIRSRSEAASVQSLHCAIRLGTAERSTQNLFNRREFIQNNTLI